MLTLREGLALSNNTITEQVLSRRLALELTDMPRGVVDCGTGTGVRRVFGIRADVAGKTGTMQYGADSWFVLVHLDLVAGTGVGFAESASGFAAPTGAGASTTRSASPATSLRSSSSADSSAAIAGTSGPRRRGTNGRRIGW